ncbi:MAG: 16S rRNA (cytosine(1402)-N(4))-methyltransferase RsmH [Planctomycetes bacterium]|nr:16S rRNA (cytosine(1402)-N(4))-methyltransferase RsmH [Planctomycetota bacterium]
MVVGSGGPPPAGGSSEPVRVHEPVLLAECLEVMDLAPGMTVIDGTLGAAGHSVSFGQAIAPGGRLVGLDRDEEILQHAERALRELQARCDGLQISLHHVSFAEMARILESEGLDGCDRVFLDLGVSSLQLDSIPRGFTFMHDAPLDMRMDRQSATTAEAWLRQVNRADLERVLRDYGGEKFARRIAGAIVEARRRHRIERTSQLVDIIAKALPAAARRQRIHFATRSFQAIRIAVNDELGMLERGLEAALRCLRPGGRLAVIAFHSAEDRICKRFLRERMDLPFRKPIVAGAAEVLRNPRARSARLRCGVKREVA